MTTPPGPVPSPLRWAIWLLRGEAVALGLVTMFLIYEDLTATANDLISALFITGFALVGTGTLWALAAGLGRRRSTARGPAIVLQFMLLPVGYYMIQGGLGWLGGLLAVLGLLVCGLLVSPATTEALGLGGERR